MTVAPRTGSAVVAPPPHPAAPPSGGLWAVVRRAGADRRLQRSLDALVVLGLLATPFLGTSDYQLRVVTVALIYVPLSLGQNLITGYGGQISMGHAAFYGVGAYTFAILATDHDWGTLPAVGAAIVVAAAVGLVVGLPALRVSGDYLFIVTIGLNLIFLDLVVQQIDLTGGSRGIPGVPLPTLFGNEIDSERGFYFLALGAAAIATAVTLLLVTSRFGRTVEALRDDEIAAAASGVSAVSSRLVLFVVSAGLGGLAGATLAPVLGFVGPQNFGLNQSLLIFEMAIIGGLASVRGSIVGAAIIIGVPEALRSLQDYRIGIGGAIIVVLMAVRPEGILGRFKVTGLWRR